MSEELKIPDDLKKRYDHLSSYKPMEIAFTDIRVCEWKSLIERISGLETEKQSLQQEVERLKKQSLLPCGHSNWHMLTSEETKLPLYCELCDSLSSKDDRIDDLTAERDAERQRAEVAELALEFAIRHPGIHIEMAKAEARHQLERGNLADSGEGGKS